MSRIHHFFLLGKADLNSERTASRVRPVVIVRIDVDIVSDYILLTAHIPVQRHREKAYGLSITFHCNPISMRYSSVYDDGVMGGCHLVGRI